ncbi:MAG TPA: DUF4130 domain-containing protein [Acetobacteraceae bacterium]
MLFPASMRRIALHHETDWDGWRAATRELALSDIPPEQVHWRIDPAHPHKPAVAEGSSFAISRNIIALAAQAIQARDPERFDLLYRLVWRARSGERVLEDTADPEVRRVRGLALAVRAEQHRMRSQLRYLPVENGPVENGRR